MIKELLMQLVFTAFFAVLAILKNYQRIHPVLSRCWVLHGSLEIPFPCLDHRELLPMRCISSLNMTRGIKSGHVGHPHVIWGRWSPSYLSWLSRPVVHGRIVNSISRIVRQDNLSDSVSIRGVLHGSSHHSVSIWRSEDGVETWLGEVIVLRLSNVPISRILHVIQHWVSFSKNEVSLVHLLILIGEPELAVEKVVASSICGLCLLERDGICLDVLIFEKVKFWLLKILVVYVGTSWLPQPHIWIRPDHHEICLSRKVAVGMLVRDSWMNRS